TEQLTDVTNSGEIHGGKEGIHETALMPSSSKGVTITNNKTGLIEGSDYGIHFLSALPLTVKNMGEISTGAGNDAVRWAGNATITNSGVIVGDLYADLAGSINTITNSGKIFGDLSLFNGADTVNNTGTINGDLRLYDGKNVVTNGGQIYGDITFGVN